MADTIDRVCAGNASLKGWGDEPFHLAVNGKTLCGIDWKERGWLFMDSDCEVEAALSSSECCRRCHRAAHKS